jgi:GNAT superfamily N-acetyltransferase
MLDFGLLTARAVGMRCYVADWKGVPAGAAAMFVHEGVGLLAGASTAPEFRRRGVQAALLAARLTDAARTGCDLAMMVALPGSSSQRNAERRGFRIGYTRTKWCRRR